MTRSGGTIALTAGAAIAATGFKSGGYFPEMWSWITFAFAFVLLAALITTLPKRWARGEVLLAGGLLCLAGWTLLTALWSVDASQTIREAERALLYAVAVAAILLVGEKRRVPELAAGVGAGSTVVVTYALGHYLFASHPRPAGFEGFLLFRPVGYANAVGILAAIAFLLAIGFAVRGERRAMRAVAAAALVPLAATIVLTGSHGSWLALGVGLICMFAFERDRTRLIASLLVVAPAPAVAVWLSGRANLSNGTPFFQSDTAEHLGFELIVLTLVAAAGSALVRLSLSRRTALVIAAAVSALAVAAAVVAASGATPSGSPRSQYWHAAWREWKTRPLLGTGGGTFARYWTEAGTGRGAQDAHNLYLETLAELGLIGLALLLALLALPLIAAARARRNPLVPALVGAYAAYLFHAGLDWDWEMPVVTLGAFFCAVALFVAGRDDQRAALGGPARLAAAGVTGAILVVAGIELVANGAIAS